ncbi:ammonium transporter [Mucisphaera sp.]|uniref:ammonium transporter n=1 Tax=Mucisphaera sp. TaxID=2913024 RepID=UPI003D14A32A
MLERIRGWLIPLLAVTLTLGLTQGVWAQDEAAAVMEAASEAAESVDTAAVEAEVAALNAAIPPVIADEYEYVVGEDDDGNPAPVLFNLNDFKTNNLWIMIAGCLVFIMHLGFAMVESGLTRAKNTVNILFKNVMIVMLGIVAYGVCGWIVMYPSDWQIPGIFAFGFGIGGEGIYSSTDYAGITPAYNTGYTVWTDFFFQAMFAATCCTIISGAVAGRIKLLPFLIFCPLFVVFAYCVVGSWKWGGGWLEEAGFADFAGSTLVHAVGGAGALAGALILGPRLGKYAKDGTVQPIPGHSMPLATIGVFLLWFGWFGFNGGSELTADPAGVSYVLVTTTFAACGGGIAAAAITWIINGKPDLSMTLNGILAGLVGVTAGPDVPSWIGALVICGMIPGVLVYFSVVFFDKLKIDDPVGAISVHGVCGIYGTCAVAFSGAFEGNFGNLGVQALGAFAGVGFAFVVALIFFGILNAIFGMRVSEAEEIEGLDLGEHDMSAYPDFQFTYIKSYHAREI